MVQGTMSNSGKSTITAGLCRIFMQDGYKVAPFKSQNMALNSYITKENLEIGRAQAMQAEACGVEPTVFMNPILLKPSSDMGSQVILNGEVLGNMMASEYFNYKVKLIPEILKSFEKLASENDIIVIEGAGSPAEINLRENDIVNMGMAKMANSPVILVGDIDRGGVFASLYGTVKLLEKDEQNMIKGLVINKFRGDIGILDSGLGMLEEITEKKVVGVVPMIELDIDDEDSLSTRFEKASNNKYIDVVIVKLPHISNFTDFNFLDINDNMSVRYVKNVKELKNPDLIIIPGTKNTISDLIWLRENGLENSILKMEDTPIIGICGGYQMLGKTISDPLNVEGKATVLGMGLLDIDTVFEAKKTRTRVCGKVGKIEGFYEKLSDATFEGYEIHMGKTTVKSNNFAILNNGENDGNTCKKVLGSYVHGIFDSGNFTEKLVQILLENKGIEIDSNSQIDIKKYKDMQYDKLADQLRKSLDIEKIYKILEEGI